LPLSRKIRAFKKWLSERKSVENPSVFGTMEETTDKGKIDVHIIGRINRDIYKCITDDIVTDEVIITDN